MALKFRLRGLAETFLTSLCCPHCGYRSRDEEEVSTEETRVTFDGIVVVVTCSACTESYVPSDQRLGIVDSRALREAVVRDSQDTGEPVLENIEAVRAHIERQNANRRNDIH
ncbi:hypothetical protein MRY87_03850 [bacterium]|nr:hypothetical protein [bacterium]